MHLVPTQEEVIKLLRSTGALRDGHFEYTNGLHTNQHIETALAMRSYQNAKVLSVGLSRLLRANPELKAVLGDTSIVAATTSGLPVAYGLSEVLQPKQVYWAEKEDRDLPMHFRQGLGPVPGERVVLVDDILRTGLLLTEAKNLLEAGGAQVIALAVLVYEPTPATLTFGDLPVYQLAKLAPRAYIDALSCDLCKRHIPLQRIDRDPKWTEAPEIPVPIG
jgi:orotate phosphoribosyltransferase